MSLHAYLPRSKCNEDTSEMLKSNLARLEESDSDPDGSTTESSSLELASTVSGMESSEFANTKWKTHV